jgi:hypothetical protein
MKRQASKRRNDRHTSLRIDVGLILLPKLGDGKITAELSRQGVHADVIRRLLYQPGQRRSAQLEDCSSDRRIFAANMFSWFLFWKFKN